MMHFEETPINGKKTKMFKKKELKMEDRVTTKQPNKTKTEKKPKMTLTIFTYLNFRRFGVCVSLDDGIKINIAWFETHIKFSRI